MRAATPGEWLEHSPILNVLCAALGFAYLVGRFRSAPEPLAAHDLKAHLGWMVAVYDLGEVVANLIQPFWMVPTLALLGLKARDIMGFTFVVFLVLLPLVLLLVTVLGLTLTYPL